jgi:hypothetical protein
VYLEGLLYGLSEEQRFEAADTAVMKIEDEVAAAVAAQETLNTWNQRSIIDRGAEVLMKRAEALEKALRKGAKPLIL